MDPAQRPQEHFTQPQQDSATERVFDGSVSGPLPASASKLIAYIKRKHDMRHAVLIRPQLDPPKQNNKLAVVSASANTNTDTQREARGH